MSWVGFSGSERRTHPSLRRISVRDPNLLQGKRHQECDSITSFFEVAAADEGEAEGVHITDRGTREGVSTKTKGKSGFSNDLFRLRLSV